MRAKVNPRARSREDRAGDPLDGLVNLFDLGIVLSVAFLLAALSSLKLTGAVFEGRPAIQARQARADAIVAERDQRARPIKLRDGQRVVGHGARLGTVYRLEDGRTVIVRKK